MNPSPWPDWLENIWAKSSIGNGKPGESLAKHTQLVLERFSDLVRLRPHLATYLDAPRLWHCLYWSCFLHDFGKAAPGFQAMVRGGEPWQRRHEVLSLVFLDWIAPAFSQTEQRWILAAIVSHHRDEKEISHTYDPYTNPELVEEMISSLDEETVRGLWRWLYECATPWIDNLDLTAFGVQAVSLVIEHIVNDVQQGKSVLVCCNTVQRAQDMRSLLAQYIPLEQIELIHSRFIMRDRLEREKAIKKRCEVDVEHAKHGLAVVATQVVEVSLNIDLDTIYSDPAPLDALVQRFGRVNRARKKGIVPVHVLREPRDGQHIYLETLVQKTLAVLEKQNNNNIDEAAIGKWLDEIYSAPEIHTPWQQAFDAQYKLATELLKHLRPFNSDEQREKEFEELFDGIDVLPRCFEREYIEHMAQDEFIEASQFFVNISQKRYQQLAHQGKIRPMDDTTHKKWVILQDYDPVYGLIFETAKPGLDREQ